MRPILVCLLGFVAVFALATTADAGMWPDEAANRGWHGYNRFEFNGFPVPSDEFPVRLVFLGEPPLGVTVEEVEQIANDAALAWSSVPCASAQVVYGGRRQSLEELRPGEVPFYFAVPELTPCFPEGTIGWTALVCNGGFPDKTIFLNTNIYDWASEPEPFQPAYVDPQSEERLVVDFGSVLVHEVGHVLGLSHTDDRLATMYASYRGDGGQRSLAVDDKLGLCSMYPAAAPGDECSSGRDCAFDERCEHIEGMQLCRERRGRTGDACALDRLVCEEVCVLPPDEDRFGYCTSACEEDSGCPTGFSCTQGLINPEEKHCERTQAPVEPTCSAAPGRRRLWPAQLLWVVVLIGVLQAGRLSSTRGFR